MEKKEEISTNEYLRGIVLNLPESPGIYQYLNAEGNYLRWKSQEFKAQSLFLFQQRTSQWKDTSIGQQDCRHPLYRSKNGRGCSLTRK